MPVDRYYIEAFLGAHSADIRGRVLEIGDAAYSRRFGGNRIERQDVLHLRSGEPNATIWGDLSQPNTLPPSTFDCIIFTQTLQMIFDMPAAIAALRHALRANGTLLVTAPGISPVDRDEWKDTWYWSLTEQALAKLLDGPFDIHRTSTRTYGNLFAATAFLHGASVEDTGKSRLEPLDPAYPVLVTARAKVPKP